MVFEIYFGLADNGVDSLFPLGRESKIGKIIPLKIPDFLYNIGREEDVKT